MAEINLIKISELPATSTIGDADELAVVQGGATKKVPYSVLKDGAEVTPDTTLSEAGVPADAAAVGAALALKANQAAVTQALATKADKTEVTGISGDLSALAGVVETKADQTALNQKADKTTTDALRQDLTTLNGIVNQKADKTELNAQIWNVTAELATKANTADVNNLLAAKANIASPVFTGRPQAPTAAKGTATLQLATTAFVQNAIDDKEDKLTFDQTPTQGSTNPVTSGGIYQAIPALDGTLTVAGDAADAKITGDAITELKNDLNYGLTAPSGYVLRSTDSGHGTEWAMFGTPTDAQAETAINAWLDAHPEATTTVQDGSLTLAKFKSGEMPFVTPEQFGAKGTGNVDDSASFQNAVNSGFPVFVGNKYKVSNISIPSNVVLFGNGEIIQGTVSAQAISAQNASNIVFDGITFTSIVGNFSSSSRGAFQFESCENIIVRNTKINAVSDRNVVFKTCKNCTFYNSTGYGDGAVLTIYNSDFCGAHDVLVCAGETTLGHAIDVYAYSYISTGCFVYNIIGYKCKLNLLQMSTFDADSDIVCYNLHDISLYDGYCVVKLRGLTLAHFYRCNAYNCDYAFSTAVSNQDAAPNICDVIVEDCIVENMSNNYALIAGNDYINNITIKNSTFIKVQLITSSRCQNDVHILNNTFETETRLIFSQSNSASKNIIFEGNKIHGSATQLLLPQGAAKTLTIKDNNINLPINSGILLKFLVGERFIFTGNTYIVTRLPDTVQVNFPSGVTGESIEVFHYGNIVNEKLMKIGGNGAIFTEKTYAVAT